MEKNKIPEIEVKIHKIFNDRNDPLRGVASVTIGGAFAVHGVRIVDSKNGVFVSMPRRPHESATGEKKHSDIFHPICSEARQVLHQKVLAAYEAKLEE